MYLFGVVCLVTGGVSLEGFSLDAFFSLEGFLPIGEQHDNNVEQEGNNGTDESIQKKRCLQAFYLENASMDHHLSAFLPTIVQRCACLRWAQTRVNLMNSIERTRHSRMIHPALCA